MEIRDRWRRANPAIVRFWYTVSDAAKAAVQEGHTTVLQNGLRFARELDSRTSQDFLTIQLPSGRKLFYAYPRMTEDRWGRPSIGYMGVNQKKWVPLETYGGKLVENITQAVARDCLAEAIERLEAAGLPVVFHVHDEVVIDAAPWADEKTMLQTVVDIMRQPVPWAPGLPLNADGWAGRYFRKD